MGIGYILIISVIVIALLATLAVGFSKENKDGNPEYDRKHGKKWTRLSLLYVIVTVLSLVALFWYIST
ncbi:heme/copper-type cytochrome/quinol oxidase subunit 2 [Paenibacillus phyllosphaerae]|uniref:Heme/copper-type cytochrome/quinol oxidase subunit 2 n=1 Tax=Paenibacillus phyllosphaerae TaxID=274593 RepID=A0A7W5B2M6_9BACL|nr:hypothetical protein [Paenibacillus phyllosphaerae]MBB3112506.1 heme/copper-type cytochrome/quinol oxidase subunit 2 [Paenibacillus phyllosphaerae]